MNKDKLTSMCHKISDKTNLSFDVITPYPIDYKFKSIFSSDDIEIKAYPIETMLSEKLQTIYSRGFLNSRSKDYYDLPHQVYF